MEFGTGALKITPGTTPTTSDGRKHGLDEITVIGEDGRITEAAPERPRHVRGRRRAAVVAALREEDLISGAAVRPVPHSRSGMRIEPLISLQWFCDMTELARPAIVVGQERVRVPSREPVDRRLPALAERDPALVHLAPALVGPPDPRLYRGDELYVGEEAPEGEGWERDPDVLDTWFVGAVAVRHAGLADGPRSCARSTPRMCSSPAATSSSSGSPAW